MPRSRRRQICSAARPGDNCEVSTSRSYDFPRWISPSQRSTGPGTSPPGRWLRIPFPAKLTGVASVHDHLNRTSHADEKDR